MADEKQEQSQAKKEKSSFPFKKIAMLLGGAFLAVAITFTATYIMLTNKLGDPDINNKAKITANANEELQPIGATFELADMPVTIYSESGRARFLSVKIVLELENEGMLEELEKRKPQLQDLAIKILSTKGYEVLSKAFLKDEEGNLPIEKLQEEMREKLNASIMDGKIVSVFFPKFIIQ